MRAIFELLYEASVILNGEPASVYEYGDDFIIINEVTQPDVYNGKQIIIDETNLLQLLNQNNGDIII